MFKLKFKVGDIIKDKGGDGSMYKVINVNKSGNVKIEYEWNGRTIRGSMWHSWQRFEGVRPRECLN